MPHVATVRFHDHTAFVPYRAPTDAEFVAFASLARGSYQSEVLRGGQRWSGGDLKGRASKYGARYAASRDALISRLRATYGDVRRLSDASARGWVRVLVPVDGEWVAVGG